MDPRIGRLRKICNGHIKEKKLKSRRSCVRYFSPPSDDETRPIKINRLKFLDIRANDNLGGGLKVYFNLFVMSMFVLMMYIECM